VPQTTQPAPHPAPLIAHNPTPHPVPQTTQPAPHPAHPTPLIAHNPRKTIAAFDRPARPA
jgi:hypothetical protein